MVMEFLHSLVLVLGFLQIQLGIDKWLNDSRSDIMHSVRTHHRCNYSGSYYCNRLRFLYNLCYCDNQSHKNHLYTLVLMRIDCG